MGESKTLGALLVIVALVFGGPTLMSQAEALTSEGGIWVTLPAILQYATIGMVVIVVVVTVYLAFGGDI